MVYVPHIRLTAGGLLGTATPAPEEWSCTLNFELGSGMVAQTNVDTAYGAWSSWLTSGYTNAAASLEYIKASEVDATGHVVGAVLRKDASVRPTASSILHPFQCAMVASLVTGQRGISRRGRIFLPAPLLDVLPASGLISTADQAAYQSGVATFLASVKTAMGASRPLVVASSKGYNTTVTGVKIGRTIDTQRRRRRSLDESYGTPTAI